MKNALDLFRLDGKVALMTGGTGIVGRAISKALAEAGAAALAGLRKAAKLGEVSDEDMTICLVTGHGFKGPDSVRRAAEKHVPALTGPDETEDNLVETASCA